MVELEQRHIKTYPHFGCSLSLAEANAFVNDSEQLSTHAFYPFIEEPKQYQPYRGVKSGKPKKKIRKLMRAAPKDAAVFAAYRLMLHKPYDDLLNAANLQNSVIAYRHVPVNSGKKSPGKCNIHHAFDAFETIKQFDRSVAVVLDISKYFDHIDHRRLKRAWCHVLGEVNLPPDHYKVFKAITSYAVVDFHKALMRLGLTREVCDHLGKVHKVPQHKKKIPRPICTAEEFSDRIVKRYQGEGSLVRRNHNGYGIPQGSPISDLLANFYLFEFDQLMKAKADAMGGIYRRYSDDILFIIPGGLDEGRIVREEVQKAIGVHGEHLVIKREKTHVVAFERIGDQLMPTDDADNLRHPIGLEYLGFRFDGKRVWFRDSTVSKLRRRVRKLVKVEAYRWAHRYPNRSINELVDSFPVGKITPKVGRMDPLLREELLKKGKRTQSFWTYAQKAVDVFGYSSSASMLKQIQYKKWIRKDAGELLRRYQKKPQTSRVG